MANTTVQPVDSGSAALAAADALVAEGKPLEAIRVLTDVDRTAPDARLEERLVEIRHEAFESLDRRPADFPTITADPQPPGPLPELGPDDLTVAALREGFAKHGCVVVRGLISAERAAGLAEGVDRALAGAAAAKNGAPRSETTPWYAPFRPSNPGKWKLGVRRQWMSESGVWTVDSPRMLFNLVDLLEETGIAQLVTDHLGERPALSATKCTLRRTPVDSDADWHQDGSFLTGTRTVNLWLALSPIDADSPGLDFVPRRIDQILETGTRGAHFDWSVSTDIVKEWAEDTPVMRPEFAPGDAMLFDQYFIHRTAVSPGMTRPRHAMETWMFSPSSYPPDQIPLVY